MSDAETGIIFDIKRYSLHDGPGLRTTVFMKGCPLSCDWCHNPEGRSRVPEFIFYENKCIAAYDCIDVCPQDAITKSNGAVYTDQSKCLVDAMCIDVCFSGAREVLGREVTVQQIVEEVERDTIFYDTSGGGVTFSGGEPLLQHEFLHAALKELKARGFHTCVDTSGYIATDALKKVMAYVDLFLFDVKMVDETKHKGNTGVPNDLILKNLNMLSEANAEVIVRLPLIPGVNDDDDNITKTGELLKSLGGVNRVDILPYHKIAKDKYRRLYKPFPEDIPEPLNGNAEKIAERLREFQLIVEVGG